jgi:hypothetical protein
MDESSCKIVSSRGIRKAFKDFNNVFYIRNHELHSFNIPTTPFILITGDSDTTVDEKMLKAKEILNSKNLIHWFSQNLGISDPRCSHIPIGIDYHSLSPEEFNPLAKWWGSKQWPLFQEAQLLGVRSIGMNVDRIPKIYCNFIHALWIPARAECLKRVKHTLLAIENEKVSRITTWNNMIKYKFILSPPGVGLDCHRTWEALVLGCIPIVKSSCIDKVYEGLPVWIVKNWEEANCLENCPVTNDGTIGTKLTLEYWINKIKLHLS